MKKIILSVLLFIMFIPFIVNAEDYKYQITAKVELDNKEIEENEFTFELIDSDGNVIDTKKNDTNGNITFDSITFSTSDVDITGGPEIRYAKDRNYGYRFYMIKQVVESDKIYQYDVEKSYVGVYFFADGTSEVHYLKDINKTIDEWSYKANPDPSKIFHATEEQLQGQAYAVLDKDTGILTFFRDEENKYQNLQTIDNKTYYTGFENTTSYDSPWSYSDKVKKIIFKDAIKPLSIYSWFYNLSNLEEADLSKLDISLITSFRELFKNDKKLKKLDLSTWDTSKVTNMTYMFEYCENLEEVNMDNFDVRKVTDMSYAFYHAKVKTIDFFAFKTENLEFCSNLFDSSDGLKAVDLSKWNTPKNGSGGCGQVVAHTTSVRFLDVSNLRMLSSNEIAFNKNLSILRLSGKYDSISTSLGNYDYYWYNIDNNTLYRHAFNNDPFYNHLKTLQDWEPATYIRPDNNPTPSVFNNKYIVPVEENITINIRENENTKLSDIFPKLLTTDEDIEWTVADSSIVKIEKDEIIPLKVGETDISTQIQSQDFKLHVTVIDVPSLWNNPKTGDQFFIILAVILISFGIRTFIYKKKRV